LRTIRYESAWPSLRLATASEHRPAEAQRAVDQCQMAQRLREVAQHSPLPDMPLFGQQSDIVAQRQHPFEVNPGLGRPPLHFEGVGKPAGASNKGSFVRAIGATPTPN
jgi:hypothetical protein